MKQDITPEELSDTLKWVFRCILLLLILLILFFFLQPTINLFVQSVKSNRESHGQFGDWFGGFIGTIISGVTLFFVGLTYWSQKKELKQTQDQMNKQQFETVFFNMLEMIHTMGKEFPEKDQDNFFVHFMNQMRLNYEPQSSTSVLNSEYNKIIQTIDKKLNLELFKKDGKRDINKDLVPDGRRIFSEWRQMNIENEQEYVGLLYLKFFVDNNSELGHFFRYIYNTIKYSIEERGKYGDEEKYINLIQSQLTNYQLVVFFYNCISPVSLSRKGKPRIKNWLDKYEVFQNVPVELLIRPFHQDFYPNTKFKEPHIIHEWSEEDFNMKDRQIDFIMDYLRIKG